MDAGPEKVGKKQLSKGSNSITSQDTGNSNYDWFVFTDCKSIEPDEVAIQTNLKSPDWQIGFYDADGEVYFRKVELENGAGFFSLVRNYWWNGKEGNEKKEGYYSLIKSVKKLYVYKQHINDLLDYVGGRYEVGEHWQTHELDRKMELRICNGLKRLEETTVEQLSKYFDNIWCNGIRADLKTENNIIYSCHRYKFENCKGVVPQKFVINTTVEKIYFDNANDEVHIPVIVMEEKADLKSIIENYCGKYYSLLPYVQTLVIKNNPKVLCDLADYINRRYKINNNRWQLHELNKNMRIVIERPGIAFGIVKEITDYFVDVLVDNNNPEQYLAKQQPYQKSFQEHFDRYDLKTDQIENFVLASQNVLASQELRLKGGKLNVGGSSRRIDELHVNQEIEQKQFICFHDTSKPVVIDKIVIDYGGDLRCVLQNAYYNGTDSSFFSLLQTAKELKIHSIYSNRRVDNQVLVDLADYIEGKYTLNTNWKQEELDKDMKIMIYNNEYGLSLSVVRRLRNYFKSVSIDCIWTQLKTENIIDQECGNKFIFVDSRGTNPQKLIINAKLISIRGLILFNRLINNIILILFSQADGEVHIPEITIDEQGCFAAIVHNEWQNNKEGDEKKYGYYSLIQHVETLTIRNNPGALKDLVDYVVGKYEIGNSNWKLQQLSKDINIIIEGPRDAFLHVFRISKYFQSVIVDGKYANNYIQIIEQEELKSQDYKVFGTCFWVHGLFMYPLQYGVEVQNDLELVDCVYNIRKSVDTINSLTVRQKLDIKQFVCFHDIDKAVTVKEIVIDSFGDLRSILQNAYYSNGQGGFFSLLETAKRLEIGNNKQAAEDLADYIDGKYALHPKWERYTLNRNMEIKLRHDKYVFSLDVARRLRNYFKSVLISTIQAQLETENLIDQECENQYIFSSCRNANPQKLVVNAKLEGSWSLIMFNDADCEVYIPKIMIDEHGDFDAIVYNQWQVHSESKYNDYSLVSHVETLTIQNNPKAVCDLDSYVSGNYKIEYGNWKIQKLNENIIIRINGVKNLNEQMNRLKSYFGYIVIDGRKVLGNQRREAIANIKLDDNKIQRRSTANADKHNTIAQTDAEIVETRRRIERARARLGRRRARFQEYLALAE